jgi:hypothetical protein
LTPSGDACRPRCIPDRFASEGAAAQRVAMQWSVRVNEAYGRLKEPLARAAYLCEIRAHPIAANNNTAMPSSFLMEQMTWREALDEAKTLSAVTDLETQVSAVRQPHAVLWHVAARLDEPTRRCPLLLQEGPRFDVHRTFAQTTCEQRLDRFNLDLIKKPMALLQISEPGGTPDPHQRRVAVGIDLGTTHSLVAAVRQRRGGVFA